MTFLAFFLVSPEKSGATKKRRPGVVGLDFLMLTLRLQSKHLTQHRIASY